LAGVGLTDGDEDTDGDALGGGLADGLGDGDATGVALVHAESASNVAAIRIGTFFIVAPAGVWPLAGSGSSRTALHPTG
jgi:hypothetical protein